MRNIKKSFFLHVGAFNERTHVFLSHKYFSLIFFGKSFIKISFIEYHFQSGSFCKYETESKIFDHGVIINTDYVSKHNLLLTLLMIMISYWRK